jgi:hypothetical protein
LQTFYLDNNDGFGPRDFTKFLDQIGQIQHEKDKPALWTARLVPVGDITQWVIPTRGAYVRVLDPRWTSRTSGAPDGVVWTGYITEPPDPVLLGGKAGQPVYGYTIKCTSEDYLANLKSLPQKTYINKTRGQILRDLLGILFQDATVFPYNLDHVHNGGTERLFQTDVTKKFTDVVADFAKSDGFTFFVHDGFFHYQPQAEVMPNSNDPAVKLVIDRFDPRYSVDAVAIKPVGSSITNDITVLGDDEPTTFVRERFISDGYQPFFQLAFRPFGSDANILILDDFTSDAFDNIWTEVDLPSDYLRLFEGSLNIVGGAGVDGQGAVYLRSNRGIELAGIVECRDGEVQPQLAAGKGILGGLYASATDIMLEADIFAGWKMDADSTLPLLYPIGPDGIETVSAFSMNRDHHYVLHKRIEVTKATRSASEYQSTANDFVQPFSALSNPTASCWIEWTLDEIVDDDPANVFTVTHTVLRKQYQNITDYVIYAPVVSYDLQTVLNFVEVDKPQQVTVLVDGAAVRVGNALDGGRCIITVDNNVARLAWYATPIPAQANKSGQLTNVPDIVTIPPQGSIVEVQYWQNDMASAHVRNLDSIASERQQFHDDGLRQQIVKPGDIKPLPVTSEECTALALAMLADRSQPRYEGTYTFITNESDNTSLTIWPRPGDFLPVTLALPDGTSIDQRLPISKIQADIIGSGAYKFVVSFGSLNRVQDVIRDLILKRASTLDSLTLQTIPPVSTIEAVDDTTPADPSFTVTSVTTNQFTIELSTATEIVGYETREDDTGWGQPNFVAQFTGPSHTFARSQRDQSYWIRPYNASGEYSHRSAFVRVQYPLPNALSISAGDIAGTISPQTVEVVIQLPNSPDMAGLVVRVGSSSGSILYRGDGVASLEQATGVNVLAGTSSLTVRIPNTGSPRTYTVWVAPFDLLGTVGTGASKVIDTPNPNVTGLQISPTDPGVVTWAGSGSYEVTLFDQVNSIIKSWEQDAEFVNLGDPALKRSVEVVPIDAFGSGAGSTLNKSGDFGVPSTASLSQGNLFLGSDGRPGFQIVWAFPDPANFNGVDEIEGQFATDNGFSSFYTIPLEPQQDGSYNVHYSSSTVYVRIRAHNGFGWSGWSNTVSVTTGSYLDPIGLGGLWNFGNPSIDTFIKLAGGHTISQADDGTGRSLAGLSALGRLGLDIPFGILQFDSGGIGRTIANFANNVSVFSNGPNVVDWATRAGLGLNVSGYFQSSVLFGVQQFNGSGTLKTIANAGHSISLFTDGATTLDGAGRALSGLNSGGFLARNLPFLIQQLDGGGTPRTLINGSQPVSALSDGSSVTNGANRAFAGLDGSGFLYSRIESSVVMYASNGSTHNVFLESWSSLDVVFDGSSYAKTSYAQRNGAQNASFGLDGSGAAIVGVNSSSGFISSDVIWDQHVRVGGALDAGGDRVSNDRVDGFSVRSGAIFGGHLAADLNGFLSVPNTLDYREFGS